MNPPGEHDQAPAARRDTDREGDEALLKELRERFDYASAEWAEIRAEAATDMRYVGGDPWDPEDRQQREEAGRPCLALDELGQHFNQVINGVRSNKRAIQFSAVGNGATAASARFYTDHTREIEYRSHAQIAYTTAFQDAIHRSYGFCRLTTKFEHGRSFNQDVWIEPVVNPDMVLPDPDALKPDSSDMKFCFVIESRTHDEFKREFKDAKVTDFTGLSATYPAWVKESRILIAEYWTITTRRRTLLQIQAGPDAPPIAAYEDELVQRPSPAQILQERDVDEPSVVQYLTNGVEILKTTPWAGKYIPIASCYGMVIYVANKRVILSMTRLARDPYMLYCYYRTCQAELVGMTPKTPYMAYEGQFSKTHLSEVQKSLHEPVAVLFANALTPATGGTVLPLPQRQPYDPPIQSLEMGAESARRAIQSAMGSSPLPTSAQRRNEKSGIALQQIEDTSQRGSAHFNDHYDDLIRHVGVMIEDLLDKILDTPRDVGVREPGDTVGRQRVNDPNDPASVWTKGDHAVTVSTGPAYESERAAEKDFADTLMATPFAPLIADLAVKLKGGGPVLDEIAERLTPPQFKKPKEGEGPGVPELQQQLQQAQGQLQQAAGAAQQLQQEIATKKAETDSRERIAQAQLAAAAQQAEADADKELALQVMKNAATIAVAHIAAASKGASLQAHAAEEAQALGHAAAQADAARQHEAQGARFAAAQAAQETAQGQQHEIALQDQAGQQAAQQQQMATDQAAQQLAQQQAAPAAQPPAGEA